VTAGAGGVEVVAGNALPNAAVAFPAAQDQQPKASTRSTAVQRYIAHETRYSALQKEQKGSEVPAKNLSRAWTPLRETAEEWLDRIGYCFHTPRCTESAACRALRAKVAPAAKPYRGEAPKPRRLDWEP